MNRPLALALVLLATPAAADDVARTTDKSTEKATEPTGDGKRWGKAPCGRRTSPRCCRRSSNAAPAEAGAHRARCRATTTYLRRSLPKRTFAFVTDDPTVISVSDYDAAVKGYHVALAGCVACTNPIAVGRSGEPRLVTVKVPEKDAESLTKAVSLSRNTFGFDSLVEAKQWLDSERPFLRAEFCSSPTPAAPSGRSPARAASR